MTSRGCQPGPTRRVTLCRSRFGEGQTMVGVSVRWNAKVEEQRGSNVMKLHAALFLLGALAGINVATTIATAVAADSKGQVTFSALVEVAGKRILFDTGNDGEVFASNVKARNIDLTNLDFVVLS